jgi:cytochrome c5
MWRVVIRIGYFNDVQSRLRNRIVQMFAAMGLQNTATGTFESAAVAKEEAATQLCNVMHAIANPQQFPEVDRVCELKHLWMYIDRAAS